MLAIEEIKDEKIENNINIDKIEELQSKRNIFISCNMLGTDITHHSCTCGFEEHSKAYYYACPKCGTCKTIKTSLAFNKIQFNKSIIVFESDEYSPNNNDQDLKKYYKFNILISYMIGNHKINFTKKTITKVNVIDNINLAISFNGYTNRENMIKYYNLDTKEELSEQQFMSNIKMLQLKNSITAFNDIKTEFLYMNDNINYKFTTSFNKIENGIRQLKQLANWCARSYNEILLKANIDPNKVTLYNEKGTTPCEILGLKKYSVKQLVKYQNILNYGISINKCFEHLEDGLEDKIVPYIETFVAKDDNTWLNYSCISKVIRLINEAGISINNLYKYIYEEAPLNQFIYDPTFVLNILEDCYDMCKQLDISFNKAPKSLEKYHNTLMKEKRILKDEQNNRKIEEVSRKYAYLEKISEIDEETKEYKDKYSIILPKSANDLIKEGQDMHHCVGSYIEKMAEERSIILFLRLSIDLNTSYVTMEYNPITKSIIQIKSHYNEVATDDTIKYITKWAKEKNILISNYH